MPIYWNATLISNMHALHFLTEKISFSFNYNNGINLDLKSIFALINVECFQNAITLTIQ